MSYFWLVYFAIFIISRHLSLPDYDFYKRLLIPFGLFMYSVILVILSVLILLICYYLVSFIYFVLFIQLLI